MRKWLGNCMRGEAECNLAPNYTPKLHEKACNCLLIIHLKNSGQEITWVRIDELYFRAQTLFSENFAQFLCHKPSLEHRYSG